MSRLFLAAFALSLVVPAQTRADAFDRYMNPVLKKIATTDGATAVKQLSPTVMADHDRVLPNLPGTLIVVKTNDNRFSKLIVQPARQKLGERTLPVVLIERFMTYREGAERAVQASGQNIVLFPGFHYQLDLGQVVPADLGGDLRLVVEKDVPLLETVGKAQMWLVTKPLPGTEAKKSEKLVVGETFDQRYFNGTFKLYDDGRRSGLLTLKVADDGEVTGAYYSDKDGRKYEVHGRIGNPKQSVQFTIVFPRTEQQFQGWLFTGDGKAITGSSRLQERETGFYAVRTEEE
jgi:hypothetical protein